MRARFSLRVAAVGFAVVAASVDAWGAASFTVLGGIRGNAAGSVARGVSADGKVVVGDAQGVGSARELFVWTAGTGMVPKGPAGNGTIWVIDVSADGSAVTGNLGSADSGPVFRWTEAGGFTLIPDVAVPPQPRAISPDGQVLGGLGGSSGFRWTQAGGTVAIPDFGIWALSQDGSAAAGFGPQSGRSAAVRWTQAGGTTFLPMPANKAFNGTSIARRMSADGSVVAGDYAANDGTRHAFLWTLANGAEDLGTTGSMGGFVFGLSQDATIVSGMSGLGATSDAWVWQRGVGRQSLSTLLTAGGVDLDGWQPDEIWDSSDDGRTLVGVASKAGVGSAAFVAVIPEPGVIGAAGVVVATWTGASRRRGRVTKTLTAAKAAPTSC